MEDERNYQSCEKRKEEYRLYLEKSGINQAISKVLISLYEQPERPPNPLDFVKTHFGVPTNVDIAAIQERSKVLEAENKELKKLVETLTKENERLEFRVKELQEGDYYS